MIEQYTLNVGCGERTYKEYPPGSGFKCINYDERNIYRHTDIIGDVRKLPWPDEYFSGLLCSDIIEHFPISETHDVLREWVRVVKPGCIIEFRLPNLKAIVEDYLNRRNDVRKDMKDNVPIAHYFSWLLYGGQDYPGNFHYVGFDRNFFKYVCSKVGLIEVDWKKEGYNMVVKMEKNNA